MMHDASFPELGERDFVTNYDRFVRELRALIDAMSDADRRSLSAHNAGWLTADHGRYLEESQRRYVNAFRLLRPYLRPSVHILDVGGFFAAFPLALRALGYRVRWQRSSSTTEVPWRASYVWHRRTAWRCSTGIFAWSRSRRGAHTTSYRAWRWPSTLQILRDCSWITSGAQ